MEILVGFIVLVLCLWFIADVAILCSGVANPFSNNGSPWYLTAFLFLPFYIVVIAGILAVSFSIGDLII